VQIAVLLLSAPAQHKEPHPRETAVPPPSVAISHPKQSLKPSFKRSSLPSNSPCAAPPCPHSIHASPYSPHSLSISTPSITPHVVTHHADRQQRSHSRRPRRPLTLFARLTATRCLFGHQLRLIRCLTIICPLPTMTTGLGFSVYELYKSATKCAQAYRAFASEYGNASSHFAAFRDELERVEQAIRLQEPINAWTGHEYSGSVVFRSVLDEARHFAEKQRRIVDRGVQSGGHASLAELLPNAIAAFEGTLPRLQERVNYNRIGLLTFDVTQLLQKSFDLDSHSTLAQLHKAVTASGLSHEQSAQVEQLLRKLSSIGSAYVRLSSDATKSTAPQLPKPDTLDNEFEGCLSSICMLIGLPSHHLASIPVNCFAGSLTNDWWHNIVHSTSQISRAPETLMPEPRTERRCRVKVKIDGTSFIAHSYVVFRRCVYWRTEQGSVLMEHRLSQSTRKCFPYTMPRMVNKPLTVTFLEMQDVSMKHPSERIMACKPRYTFLTKEDYQVFHTDVRARELVHEFHTISISHKTSRGADAHNECVKVWGPPTSSVDRSISFPAVFSSGTKNYEFPLKWFSPPATPLRTTTIRLEFTKEPGGMRSDASSISGDRPSGLRSGLKFMRRAATTSAASFSSNASIRSVSSNMANSSYAPRELVDRLGYIEIKFASASEAGEFVTAIADPFVAATPASWSSAPSLYAASSPSISSTTWSSSPLSFQGQSNTSSAHGLGPMTPTGLLQLPDAAMDKATSVMDRSADGFDLPQAGFDQLTIQGEDSMDCSLPSQALTPSSLMRDLTRGQSRSF
jgi:hypothetical protein